MIVNAPEFLQALKPGEQLVAFDPGTKTIGVALSDTRRHFASPVRTLKRGRFHDAMDEMERALSGEIIGGFVVGLPLNMDGTSGPRAQAARAFARNVAERFEKPVLLWDERLSTATAEDAMIAAGARWAERQARIDAAAAAVILQGALDHLRTLES